MIRLNGARWQPPGADGYSHRLHLPALSGAPTGKFLEQRSAACRIQLPMAWMALLRD